MLLFASSIGGIEAHTMPEPGVLPFAESVSTPPDEPQGESSVLCEISVDRTSNVAPLNWYALKWLQPSDQTYIHGPTPPIAVPVDRAALDLVDVARMQAVVELPARC